MSKARRDAAKKVVAKSSFKPPQGVADAAARGLELRKEQPKSGKAGLDAKQAAKKATWLGCCGAARRAGAGRTALFVG